jgi:hypothetical protein
MHRWDGVALSGWTNADAPNGSKFFVGYAGSATGMLTMKVAAKYEDFALRQLSDEFWGDTPVNSFHDSEVKG